jgi:hypothetical protein
LKREAELLDVVQALPTPGRFTCRLHRRQEQRDENGDDSDHHQKLYQGEPASVTM